MVLKHLNGHDPGVYAKDCLKCYNHMSYLRRRDKKSRLKAIIYPKEERRRDILRGLRGLLNGAIRMSRYYTYGIYAVPLSTVISSLDRAISAAERWDLDLAVAITEDEIIGLVKPELLGESEIQIHLSKAK